MIAWGLTIGAMVLAITAVQVAAWYYLFHDDGAATPDVDVDGDREATYTDLSRHDSGEREDRGNDVRHCSECGAPNGTDAIYRFCQRCGAEL